MIYFVVSVSRIEAFHPYCVSTAFHKAHLQTRPYPKSKCLIRSGQQSIVRQHQRRNFKTYMSNCQSLRGILKGMLTANNAFLFLEPAAYVSVIVNYTFAVIQYSSICTFHNIPHHPIFIASLGPTDLNLTYATAFHRGAPCRKNQCRRILRSIYSKRISKADPQGFKEGPSVCSLPFIPFVCIGGKSGWEVQRHQS